MSHQLHSSYDAALLERSSATIAAIVGADKFRSVESQVETAEHSVNQAKALWGINKLIDDPWLRRVLASGIAAQEILQLPELTRVESASAKAGREMLASDGFVLLQSLLAQGQIADVLGFLEHCGEPLVRDNNLRDFSISDIVRAPHLLDVALSPTVLDKVGAYLGHPPTLLDVSLWATLPATEADASGTQYFHRDRDDFRACKLFLYLDDVGPADGPHVFVLGSHDVDRVMRRLGISDNESAKELFEGNCRHLSGFIDDLFDNDVMEIIAPRGTGFLECTYGFHRGKVPTAGRRIIFQAMYGTIPYVHCVSRLAGGTAGSASRFANVSDPLVRHAARLLLQQPAVSGL